MTGRRGPPVATDDHAIGDVTFDELESAGQDEATFTGALDGDDPSLTCVFAAAEDAAENRVGLDVDARSGGRGEASAAPDPRSRPCRAAQYKFPNKYVDGGVR